MNQLRLPDVVVGLLIVAYVALMGTVALRRHQNLHTNALDLGYTDQAVWNTLHGRPFRFSTYLDAAFSLDIPISQIREPDMLLAYHVEPMLAPIALLYLLHDGPETLLWLQTVGIALGAIPLYLLARNRFGCGQVALAASAVARLRKSPQTSEVFGEPSPQERAAYPGEQGPALAAGWLAIPFVLIYLLAPSLQAANLSDFHAVALSPALLLAAFYCLETGRLRGFVAFAFLATMCKEEVGLLVAMMGLWAAVMRRRWLLGLGTAAAAAGWSLLSVLGIMPYYSGLSTSAFVVRYGHLGEDAGAVLRTAIGQPGLLVDWLRQPAIIGYLRDQWLSSGGLAILYPLTLALALPSLAINAFSSYDWMHSGGGHYSATVVPFLLISAVYGVDWLARRVARLAAGKPVLASHVERSPKKASAVYWATSLGLALAGLGIAAVHHYERGISPPSARFLLEPVSEHAWRAAALIEQVNRLPPEVPVSAGSNLYPHVAHRERVYLFPTVSDAQFVLIDVSGPGSPVGVAQQRAVVQDLMEYGQFGVAASDHGILLLERGLAEVRLSPGFYDLFEAGAALPRTVVQADFAGLLRLEGFDWEVRPVVRPERVAQLTLTWQVLAPLDEELRPVLYGWDDAGHVVRVQPAETTMYWYPAGLWAPDQRVQVVLPPLPLGARERVGVAVLHAGATYEEVTGRLSPITPAGGGALSLMEGGTIVELEGP